MRDEFWLEDKPQGEFAVFGDFMRGEPGPEGKSAYQVAVDNGFVGTETEWLASLHGKSAYEQAVAGGYTGTEAQFNAELAAFKDLSEQAASSATAAASSATAAASSATAAENAQTAAETAQGAAEDAQEAAEQAQSDAETAAQSVSQSAAQIGQNTSDIGNLKSQFTTKAENEGYIELFGGVNRSLPGNGTGSACIAFSNIADKYTFDGVFTSTNKKIKWFGLLSKPQITRDGTSETGYAKFAKQIAFEANHVYKVSSKLLSGSIIGDGVSLRAYTGYVQHIPNGAKIGETKYFTVDTDTTGCLAVRVDIGSGFANATISVTLQDVTDIASSRIPTSDLIDYSGKYVRGGYIATAGDTANINTIVENAEYGYCIVPCKQGDHFMTASFGQSTPRAWAFLSEINQETGLCTVLSKADPLSGQRQNRFLDYVEIEAPSGAAYLVCNHRYYSELSYSPVVIKMSNNATINEIAKSNHTIPCAISPTEKRYIVAAYDKYLVKLEDSKLSRSDNCGITWGNELSVSSITEYITSYHLFANGSLAFSTNTKMYYTDDFETFSEAVCYETDGETEYVPATYENFFNNSEVAERKFINGQDMYVFGNYVITGGNATRIVVWYTIDGGHSYKIAYEFNKSDTPPARHIHTVNYYEPKDVFICCTGDSNTEECRVLAMEYDVENDSWSATVLGGSSRNYKWAHVGFWNGEVYFTYDNTPGSVYKCKYNDIGDPSKWVAVLEGTDSDALEVRFSAKGEMIVTQSTSRSTGGVDLPLTLSKYKACRKIYYSSDRKHFNEIFIDPQIMDSYSTLSRLLPVTADGHLIAHAHGYDRDNWDGTPSVYLDDYVKLAGFNNAFKPL